MIDSIAGAGGVAARVDEASLRQATSQLEGVFMTHLLRTLRETAPSEGGILDSGAGEEMFTSMLDEHVAQLASGRQTSGPGAALYRQLSARLGGSRP